MTLACRICGNSKNNTTYVAREMMFGFRDEFDYFQCAECQCLQIGSIPKNLDKYYPDHYYSYSNPVIKKQGKLTRSLKRKRTTFLLTSKGIIGRMMLMLFGDANLPDWVKYGGLHVDSKILDVGCGAGDLLVYFKNVGFSNLTGFDPYIQEDLYYENGVRVIKRGLDEPSGSFDFIMLHHSFEHMLDPITTINQLFEKTVPNGHVLIRIPIVSSFAWENYRTNWVQLDAPRHLFLHSLKSMELLAMRAGFEIESIKFDSNALQFWGSEQYLHDIPLEDKHSYNKGIDGSIFTKEDIRTFQTKARELNVRKQGDQACFLMRKKDVSPNKTNSGNAVVL